MFQEFLNKSSFCAVEHCTINGQEQLFGLRLKKEAKKLRLEQEFVTDSIEGLSSFLKPKETVYLIINTGQILFKELHSVLEPREALRLAFPNLALADFYYEGYASSEKAFVVICRKEVISSIIASYQKLNYGIIGFSLGNLAMSQLAPMVAQDRISSTNASIHFKDKELIRIEPGQPTEEKMTINGLALSNTSTLSFAGILRSYFNVKTTTSNFESYNDQLKEQVKQQHFFNLGLKISLATIFVLLLFSFLQFSSYRSKIASLTAELQLKNQQKTQLVTLSEQVARKEKLIEDYSLAASNSSWYLNQVGKSVPQSILLTEIDWQPLLGAIKENESIEANQNSIIIRGISSIGADFSSWLRELEESEWVQKVAINEYGVNKKKQTYFEVELSYTP